MKKLCTVCNVICSITKNSLSDKPFTDMHDAMLLYGGLLGIQYHQMLQGKTFLLRDRSILNNIWMTEKEVEGTVQSTSLLFKLFLITLFNCWNWGEWRQTKQYARLTLLFISSERYFAENCSLDHQSLSLARICPNPISQKAIINCCTRTISSKNVTGKTYHKL